MRTNVVIDDSLMDEALKATGLPTKRAVIEEGLRKLIMLSKQASLRELRGSLKWTGDLDLMRRDK